MDIIVKNIAKASLIEGQSRVYINHLISIPVLGAIRRKVTVLSAKKHNFAALALLLSLVLLLSAACTKAPLHDPGEDIVVSEFPSDFQFYEAAVDIDFSKNLLNTLSEIGSDPITGFRSSGSQAEKYAAGIVAQAMVDAGLSNVTREETPVVGWTFTGAAITYTDFRGQKHRLTLGGYPVNMSANEQVFALLNLGTGTAFDYAEKDVKGKLVLIDADPADWNVSYPVCQAKLMGAGAVLVRTPTEDDSALITQDLYGVTDIPVFAVCGEDAAALRKDIRLRDTDELTVTLTAETKLFPNPELSSGEKSTADSSIGGTTSGPSADAASKNSTINVWGEIPGRTEDVIYVVSNYDGFYNSAFHNTAGVATILGIAKALVDSEYIPVKTIRFVAYGAGEWGSADSILQRGAGALSQLTLLHPDWPESAFAVIALEGNHPLGSSTHFEVNVSQIIAPFVKHSASELLNTGFYSYSWHESPARSGIATQDIIWELLGVPVAAPSSLNGTVSNPGSQAARIPETANFGSNPAGAPYYHSNKDTLLDLGFNDDAFLFNHFLYGKLIIDLDNALIRPVDFESLFNSLQLSHANMPASLRETLIKTANDAEILRAEIEKLNEEYLESYAAMRESMEIMSYSLNRELHKLNRELSAAFIGLDRNGHMMFAQEAAVNYLNLLKNAAESLESGDSAEALSILSRVDRSGYALAFDQSVCDFFNNIDNSNAVNFNAGSPIVVSNSNSGANAGSDTAADNSSISASGVKEPFSILNRRLQPPCKAEEIIRGIDLKIRAGLTDFTVEIDRIRALAAQWEETLLKIIAAETAAANEADEHIKMLLEDYFSEEDMG